MASNLRHFNAWHNAATYYKESSQTEKMQILNEYS